VLSTQLHVENGVFAWRNGLDFETMGYGIVGSFLVTWVGSVVWFKLRRLDDRLAAGAAQREVECSDPLS
jgi:high-affinity nickel-transport protein